MAINLRPAGTRPVPSQKTRPAPPRLCNRISGRVFLTETGFNRVLIGSGFIKKPESGKAKREGDRTENLFDLEEAALVLSEIDEIAALEIDLD